MLLPPRTKITMADGTHGPDGPGPLCTSSVSHGAGPIAAQPAIKPLSRYLFIAGAAAGPPITATGDVDRSARIQQAAVELDGNVERRASPFGDGMIYTICQLPSNRAAASFATVMQAAYATGVRTVALPKPRRIT